MGVSLARAEMKMFGRLDGRTVLYHRLGPEGQDDAKPSYPSVPVIGISWRGIVSSGTESNEGHTFDNKC